MKHRRGPSATLRMTILSGGLNTTGSICRKHEKIEKITASQDDDFVGVSKASGRGHRPSFNHTTRKLLSLNLQPANRSNLILFSNALIKAVNRLHRQKAPCSANLDSPEADGVLTIRTNNA